MKKMVYFDMDGVLADFDQHLQDMYGRPYGKDVAGHFWNEAIIEDMPFATMPQIEEGMWLLRRAREEGFNPCIMTSTGGGKHHLEIARQKLMWLQTNGIRDIPVAFCMSTKGKGAYAQVGAFLIDDREKVVRAWQDNGGVGILFTRDVADDILQALLLHRRLGGNI